MKGTLFSVCMVLLVAGQHGCYTGSDGGKTSGSVIAKACAVMNSCEQIWSGENYYSIGACTEETIQMMAIGYISPDIPYMECLSRAGGDCNKAFACLNDGHQPQSCDDSTFADRCDGSVAVSCSYDGFVIYEDCAELDEYFPQPFDFVCVMDYEYAECSSPPCEGYPPRCIGSFVEYCDDGERYAEDCGLYGATCEMTAEAADCVGTGPACEEEPWYGRCDGDFIVLCMNGREARVNCAEADPNFTCRMDDYEEVAFCGGRGSECSVGYEDEYGGDSCSGTVINYCFGGYIKSLDCRSLGFSTCRSNPEYGVAWCE